MESSEGESYGRVGRLYRQYLYAVLGTFVSGFIALPIASGIQGVFDSVSLPFYIYPYIIIIIALCTYAVFIVLGSKLCIITRNLGIRLDSRPLCNHSRFLLASIIVSMFLVALLIVPGLYVTFSPYDAFDWLGPFMEQVIKNVSYFIPWTACEFVGCSMGLHGTRQLTAVFSPVDDGWGCEGARRLAIGLKLGLVVALISLSLPFLFIASSYYAIVEPSRLYDTISTPILVVAMISTPAFGILAVIAAIQGVYYIAIGFEFKVEESDDADSDEGVQVDPGVESIDD